MEGEQYIIFLTCLYIAVSRNSRHPLKRAPYISFFFNSAILFPSHNLCGNTYFQVKLRRALAQKEEGEREERMVGVDNSIITICIFQIPH